MNMSMSLSNSLRMSQDFYEHSGQLELLSLHRIKHRIGSMEVSKGARMKLIEELVRENRDYVSRTGNDWRCITPDGLDSAVYRLVGFFNEKVNLGISTVEDGELKRALEKIFNQKVEQQTSVVRNWFSDNYDKIIYDMNSKIPYSIVRAMRARFSQWAIGQTNPFNEPIESLIDEVAVSSGLDPKKYKDSQSVWNALRKIK